LEKVQRRDEQQVKNEAQKTVRNGPLSVFVFTGADDIQLWSNGISPPTLAQAADHQRHRAMLCGSTAPHPTHGRVHQFRQRRADQLCDFRFNEDWKNYTLDLFTQAA